MIPHTRCIVVSICDPSKMVSVEHPEVVSMEKYYRAHIDATSSAAIDADASKAAVEGVRAFLEATV